MLGWGKSIFAHEMDVKFWGSEGGLLWVEFVTPKRHVYPESHNMTSFGIIIFADVIYVRISRWIIKMD